jgi:hypothetical protein
LNSFSVSPFCIAFMIANMSALPDSSTVVDGRILKRHGKLTAIDARSVVREAAAARAALLKRANWS